jgi:uncharacterized damage-inducible protein DinB
MKKFKSEDLLDELKSDVEGLTAAAKHIKEVADPVKLTYPPEEGKWSVAQILEHLNSFNRYYLPAIEKEITVISNNVPAWFVPGFWGDYFTNMMKPKTVFEVKNKMKSPKANRPDRGLNVETVFTEFLQHQQKLINLLETAKKRDLNSIKIATSISKMLRLKLGDTFRFLIAHEQRHMVQARNAIKALGISTDKFPVILEAAKL